MHYKGPKRATILAVIVIVVGEVVVDLEVVEVVVVVE
jgi:hypothetical protein